jgi:hypothetical protein
MNKVQLIEGKFSREEAIDLLNALYNVKIRFHEDRIDHQMNEEDIKIRERKIAALQSGLAASVAQINQIGNTISIESSIQIQ